MSTVMRCKMSMVHEFELSMISMVDLKHKVRDQPKPIVVGCRCSLVFGALLALRTQLSPSMCEVRFLRVNMLLYSTSGCCH